MSQYPSLLDTPIPRTTPSKIQPAILSIHPPLPIFLRLTYPTPIQTTLPILIPHPATATTSALVTFLTTTMHDQTIPPPTSLQAHTAPTQLTPLLPTQHLNPTTLRIEWSHPRSPAPADVHAPPPTLLAQQPSPTATFALLAARNGADVLVADVIGLDGGKAMEKERGSALPIVHPETRRVVEVPPLRGQGRGASAGAGAFVLDTSGREGRKGDGGGGGDSAGGRDGDGGKRGGGEAK